MENLINEYLEYTEHILEHSNNTLPPKRSYLNDFQRYFYNSRVTDLTNYEVDRYFIDLKHSVRYNGRLLSHNSLNNRKWAILVFLKWCESYKKIALNLNTAEVHVPKDFPTHKRILEFADIEYVIDRVANEQDRLVIRVMYEGGLRISEVINLKIEHLHGKKLELIGKGMKRRVTFLPPDLADDLRQWMLDRGWSGYVFRPILHGVAGAGYSDDDPIRQRVKQHFKTLLGIDMVPHQLRHAFARKLLLSGVNIRAIQKLLGHANIETTMIYLGVDDEWLEKEHEKSLIKQFEHNHLLTKALEFATIGT